MPRLAATRRAAAARAVIGCVRIDVVRLYTRTSLFSPSAMSPALATLTPLTRARLSAMDERECERACSAHEPFDLRELCAALRRFACERRRGITTSGRRAYRDEHERCVLLPVTGRLLQTAAVLVLSRLPSVGALCCYPNLFIRRAVLLIPVPNRTLRRNDQKHTSDTVIARVRFACADFTLVRVRSKVIFTVRSAPSAG